MRAVTNAENLENRAPDVDLQRSEPIRAQVQCGYEAVICQISTSRAVAFMFASLQEPNGYNGPPQDGKSFSYNERASLLA